MLFDVLDALVRDEVFNGLPLRNKLPNQRRADIILHVLLDKHHIILVLLQLAPRLEELAAVKAASLDAEHPVVLDDNFKLDRLPTFRLVHRRQQVRPREEQRPGDLGGVRDPALLGVLGVLVPDVVEQLDRRDVAALLGLPGVGHDPVGVGGGGLAEGDAVGGGHDLLRVGHAAAGGVGVADGAHHALVNFPAVLGHVVTRHLEKTHVEVVGWVERTALNDHKSPALELLFVHLFFFFFRIMFMKLCYE